MMTYNILSSPTLLNFFPSIRLEAVREHLLSQTNLAKEVVRLCVQIIDGVMPRRDYSEVSLMGLPQERSGSSRYIAHGLLLHVDEEFRREGEAGRYTRFMDDILIGASSPQAGESYISRWQLSLETLGLYPNGAKTIVTPKSQYLYDAMVNVNADIENIQNKLNNSMHGDLREVSLDSALAEEIKEISLAHRALSERPKRWDRVARRIYTLQRRAGVSLWWQYWFDDINEYPGSTAPILEYVRSWPLSRETSSKLTELSARYSTLYPDIALLAAETTVSAPVPRDDSLWKDIHQTCKKHLAWLLKESASNNSAERIAAAWLLAAWKFGNSAQRRSLLEQVPAAYDAISPVRVQALPLLVAIGKSLSEWVAAKPGMAWEDALAAEYLRSLQDGEDRAVGVALSLLGPMPRLLPQRFMVLPRALPLVEIVGRANPRKIAITAPRIIKKLEKNPDRLRDYRVEFELENWCEYP
jgi:hypothetical protein